MSFFLFSVYNTPGVVGSNLSTKCLVSLLPLNALQQPIGTNFSFASAKLPL